MALEYMKDFNKARSASDYGYIFNGPVIMEPATEKSGYNPKVFAVCELYSVVFTQGEMLLHV